MSMKQSAALLSGVIVALAMQSCVKEKNLYQEPVPTYTELSLNLGGECIVGDEPLEIRAASRDESKDVLGIAVSMIVKNGDANPTNKPYAYGVFTLDEAKKPGALKLNVIEGYDYRISCTMIKQGKDSITHIDNKFAAPFDLERNGKVMGECLNKFITAESPEGVFFLYNIENPAIKTGNQDSYSRPFIERYHGLLEKVTPNAQANNTLKLYRRYFGVIFKQAGLQEGKFRIKLDGAPDLFLNAAADKTATMATDLQMVTMRNLTAQMPSNGALTEIIKLEVFFCKDNVTPEEKILSTNITAKRNYKHTIVITNIDHMGTPSNIGIDVDEEEMQDDYQLDIPWQD